MACNLLVSLSMLSFFEFDDARRDVCDVRDMVILLYLNYVHLYSYIYKLFLFSFLLLIIYLFFSFYLLPFFSFLFFYFFIYFYTISIPYRLPNQEIKINFENYFHE